MILVLLFYLWGALLLIFVGLMTWTAWRDERAYRQQLSERECQEKIRPHTGNVEWTARDLRSRYRELDKF